MNILRAAAILAGITSMVNVYTDKLPASIVFMGIAITLWLASGLSEKGQDR